MLQFYFFVCLFFCLFVCFSVARKIQVGVTPHVSFRDNFIELVVSLILKMFTCDLYLLHMSFTSCCLSLQRARPRLRQVAHLGKCRAHAMFVRSSTRLTCDARVGGLEKGEKRTPDTITARVFCRHSRVAILSSSSEKRTPDLTRPQSSSRRGQPTRDGSAKEDGNRESERKRLLPPSHHPFLPHSRAARVMKTTGDESDA